MKNSILLLIGLFVFTAGCISQEQTGKTGGTSITATTQGTQLGGKGIQQTQSQAALSACKDKRLNVKCGFRFNGKTIRGTCMESRNGGMTCVSEHRLPSQESIDACGGKSVNDTCGFAIKNRTVNGNCVINRLGQVTCRPPTTG